VEIRSGSDIPIHGRAPRAVLQLCELESANIYQQLQFQLVVRPSLLAAELEISSDTEV